MFELPKTADVVVVGGGVIGLSVARALAKRGLARIVIIERTVLGAESSTAAAGMLAPQAEADAPDDFFELCRRSRDMYAAFATSLLEETGIDIELATAGTLYLAFTDHDVRELEKRHEWQSQAGLSVSILSAKEALHLEPSISPDVAMALKFERDTQVENRRLVSALAAANERLNVTQLTGVEVRSLKLQRGEVTGIETSEGFMSTPNVVIAAGAWSSQIRVENQFSSTDRTLPDVGIEPVRGQMLCFEANPQVLSHVVYSTRGYVVPRRDGRILAGSTSEHVGFDKGVTAAGIQSITNAALQICPQLASHSLVSSWAGLRPRAADGLPVLGPCAEIEGVFYATGHYRNGILLTPVTAELLAAAIVDREIGPELHLFSPDRFNLATV